VPSRFRFRTPRIAPSTTAPLAFLNRYVTHFTPEPRKHVICNPLLAKSGLGNVTTFLESPSRHKVLNLASSKLSSTGRVTSKMTLCFGSWLTGCESLTRDFPSWCPSCSAASRTITVLTQQFLVQDQDAHPEGSISVASIQLFQVQKSQTSTHAKVFMSHRGKLPHPLIHLRRLYV
jgi:hypothetical protein